MSSKISNFKVCYVTIVISVSKSGRDGPGMKDKKPGPGQYALGSTFGSQGKTMGTKTDNGGFLGP